MGYWRRVLAYCHAQKQEKTGFFSKVTTFLDLLGLVREQRGLFGVGGTMPWPVTGTKTPEMARPRHNSGLLTEQDSLAMRGSVFRPE